VKAEAEELWADKEKYRPNAATAKRQTSDSACLLQQRNRLAVAHPAGA